MRGKCNLTVYGRCDGVPHHLFVDVRRQPMGGSLRWIIWIDTLVLPMLWKATNIMHGALNDPDVEIVGKHMSAIRVANCPGQVSIRMMQRCVLKTFDKAAMNRRKLRPCRKKYKSEVVPTRWDNIHLQTLPNLGESWLRKVFCQAEVGLWGFFSIGRCSAPSGPRCGIFSVVLAFSSICKPPGYSRGLGYVQCMSGIWIVWDGRLLAIWCVFRVYASVVTNCLPTIRKSFATRNLFRGDPRFLCWLPTAVESLSDARRHPSCALAVGDGPRSGARVPHTPCLAVPVHVHSARAFGYGKL